MGECPKAWARYQNGRRLNNAAWICMACGVGMAVIPSAVDAIQNELGKLRLACVSYDILNW